MPNNKFTELGQTPIRQLLWRYFWPSFIGVMANSLYNIVDRIFIGQAIGAEALSGVTAVFPVMIIMTAFGMLIGIGSSVQISLSLGKKDLPQAQKILGNAVVLILIISVLVTSIGFAVKEPMLRLFGAGDTTIGYANDYLNVILWGVVLHEFGFAMNALIRAEGNARIAMYSMLISAGINIPLDALFILHWDMGVQGAAYATIISMAVLTIWVFIHFRSKRCIVPLKKQHIRLQPRLIIAILSIGISPFLMQLANSVVQATFNLNLIKYGGDLAVGAMGVINSVAVIIITSIIALNMASQPIISFNYGARQFARVKQTFKLSMILATIVAVASWIVIHAMPIPIVKAFISDNDELVRLGVTGMRLLLLMLPIIGFQIVAGNYFQSVGKASTAIFLTLLRQVIVLIPLLLILPQFFGLSGVWLSAPIADSVAAIICSLFVIREWKRLNRQIAVYQ
ncbi:MAG: MATE family efflux transporter [Bacteroidales bacterium]|nr:MATE family efflux transporter [Bacteroidales bacterium]